MGSGKWSNSSRRCLMPLTCSHHGYYKFVKQFWVRLSPSLDSGSSCHARALSYTPSYTEKVKQVAWIFVYQIVDGMGTGRGGQCFFVFLFFLFFFVFWKIVLDLNKKREQTKKILYQCFFRIFWGFLFLFVLFCFFVFSKKKQEQKKKKKLTYFYDFLYFLCFFVFFFKNSSRPKQKQKKVPPPNYYIMV